MSVAFNPVLMIEEVQKRPALYKTDRPADREEKLALWKEIGAVMYPDWDTINKATAYDRGNIGKEFVLQLQRKWRSLRDAYNRELRSRRSGHRTNKRTYRYFKRMRFLGGYEGTISDGDESVNDIMFASSNLDDQSEDIPIVQVRPKRKKRQREPSTDSNPPEEVEMPVFPIESDNESDTDKLFLLSFLPEMRQLPVHIKMWVRAQIASVMQEAVSNHYNNTQPGERNQLDVKRQRLDSLEQ